MGQVCGWANVGRGNTGKGATEGMVGREVTGSRSVVLRHLSGRTTPRFSIFPRLSKTSGEATHRGLARLIGYRGRLGVLGRRAHEITARPTLGRIRPGLPDDARDECGMFAPCRAAP